MRMRSSSACWEVWKYQDNQLQMLFTTRALLLLLITAPLLALGTWFPFMQWVAWGYALVILAMIYTDWRMAGKISQFDSSDLAVVLAIR